MELTMPASFEMQDFAHPILNQEITAIGGHYVFIKENRIKIDNKEVLYYTGYAVLDSSCCGVGGCAYAFVSGFIRQWKYKKSSVDLPISQIEPIHDPLLQQKIGRFIKNLEKIYQITFR